MKVKISRTQRTDQPLQMIVELSRRNLETLLKKLDDPDSARTLVDGGGLVAVRAVEDEEHYSDRLPGPVLIDGEIQ